MINRGVWGDGWDVWPPRKGFLPRHAFVDVAREFETRQHGPESVNGWDVRITSKLLCRIVARAARTAWPYEVSIDTEPVALGGTYQHRGVVSLHFDIRPPGNDIPWHRIIKVVPQRSTDLKAWVFTKATHDFKDVLWLRRRGDVRLGTWLRTRLTEPPDADRP
jgi:hypothetical protein